jgi:hypothetical protein
MRARIYVRRGLDGSPCVRMPRLFSLENWPAGFILRPCLVPSIFSQISLCKKKISYHIKMSANAWSTKY